MEYIETESGCNNLEFHCRSVHTRPVFLFLGRSLLTIVPLPLTDVSLPRLAFNHIERESGCNNLASHLITSLQSCSSTYHDLPMHDFLIESIKLALIHCYLFGVALLLNQTLSCTDHCLGSVTLKARSRRKVIRFFLSV